MLALQFGTAVLAQQVWYPKHSLEYVIQKPLVLIASQLVLYFVVGGCMIIFLEGKYHVPFWRSIHWNWPSGFGLFLLLGAATMMGLGMLEAFLPVPKDTPFEHLFDNPLDAYLLSIIAVTFAPLLEEVFFRGLLYPVLARRMGIAGGVFFSALPFGLIHLQQYGWAWSAGLVIFLVGVVCGIVRARTNSLAASVLVHTGYNGTQMLISIVVTHGFRHMDKVGALLH